MMATGLVGYLMEDLLASVAFPFYSDNIKTYRHHSILYIRAVQRRNQVSDAMDDRLMDDVSLA